MTKEEKREYRREYYLAHKAELAEKQRKRYQEHKAEFAERNRLYLEQAKAQGCIYPDCFNCPLPDCIVGDDGD